MTSTDEVSAMMGRIEEVVIQELKTDDFSHDDDRSFSFESILPSGFFIMCEISPRGNIHINLYNGSRGSLAQYVTTKKEGYLLAVLRAETKDEVLPDCKHELASHPWGWCKSMKSQFLCVQCGTVFHPPSWTICDCEPLPECEHKPGDPMVFECDSDTAPRMLAMCTECSVCIHVDDKSICDCS